MDNKFDVPKNVVIDFLTAQELYFLGGILKVEHIFGLPSRDVLSIQDRDYIKDAKTGLSKKGILTEDGHLTIACGILIDMLKVYINASEYIRLNNITIVPNTKANEVITLIGDYNDGYRLDLLEKKSIAMLLMKDFGIFQKAPEKWDLENTMQELPEKDRVRLLTTNLKSRPTLRASVLANDAARDFNPNYKSDRLFFFDDHINWHIICIDLLTARCYRVGQPFLYKMIYDMISIKYESDPEKIKQLLEAEG